MKLLVRLSRVWIILILFLVSASPISNAQAGSLYQAKTPEEKAKALLSKMKPQERVGQLFLVTFKGRKVDTETQIYDLIVNQHISGVVLRSANDNFTGPDNTISDAYSLISSLQKAEWDSTQRTGNIFIPLLIGLSQEGDGYPNDQILNGLTPLPNLMTIGATWKTQLAEQVGSVLGDELEALGINLFLGPSLDVLSGSHPSSSVDLGTRTFGGDPYWVGKMGSSYIKGLHEGSKNRVAVISRNFPGLGESDRPPEDEIPTVIRSLESLKLVDLPPFFEVTGNAPDALSTTDGLLVSHIRYQGFQGNIYTTTKPVSFDQNALGQIMKLDQFTAWQSNGGVIVSDDLGSDAVRRFYETTGQVFDARTVARNALTAGNDLLYADNFLTSGDQDTYTTIIRTLAGFAQQYRQDSNFAQRVDQSVLKILTLKFKLYPDFQQIDNIIPSANGLSTVGQSQKTISDVVKNAVNLISPSQSDLSAVLPNPPDSRERIVFLTDVLSTKQCSVCVEQPVFAVDALQNAVLKFYGTKSGGQESSARLASYSFTDLLNYLDGKTIPTSMDSDINLANWLVFSFLDVQSSRPASLAFERFLSEKPNLLRNKKIIAFAFNAPYYLDTTNITKLTAYYAFYNKQPESIEIAARVLFDDIPYAGAPPVSVPGIGYDIRVQTEPDPNQEILLIPSYPSIASPTPQLTRTVTIKTSPTVTVTSTGSTVPTKEPPTFKVGDAIQITTGVIYDHNKNPVPDGTPVQFTFTITTSEGSTPTVILAYTTDGVAQTSFTIKNTGPGYLDIRASSKGATKSTIFQLNLSKEGAGLITPTEPELTKTPTLTATLTATKSATPTLSPTIATATLTPTQTPIPPVTPGVGDWSISVGIIGICAASMLLFNPSRETMRWRVRYGLLIIICGLLFYCYIATGFPGSKIWLDKMGKIGIPLVTLFGIVIGWISCRIWKQIAE